MTSGARRTGVSPSFVPWLQAAHAIFNGALFLAFAFQGLTGWRNRRDRLAGAPMDFKAVRRHRRIGPVLAMLLPVGYLAGLATALVDQARLLRFPQHLLVGTLLLLTVAATAISGRKIQGRISPWRTRHAAAGAAALALFAVQALLGLSILL